MVSGRDIPLFGRRKSKDHIKEYAEKRIPLQEICLRYTPEQTHSYMSWVRKNIGKSHRRTETRITSYF